MPVRRSEEFFICLFSYVPDQCHGPLYTWCLRFGWGNGERVLHLQGHLTMAENCLVAYSEAFLPIATCCRVWTCRISLLASMCRTHVAYFNSSHFSQPFYCCWANKHRQGFCWGLEGHTKAGNVGRISLLDHHIPVLWLPVQILTLIKFRLPSFIFVSWKLRMHHLKTFLLYSTLIFCQSNSYTLDLITHRYYYCFLVTKFHKQVKIPHQFENILSHEYYY